MKKKSIAIIVAALTVVLCFVLAACGGGGDKPASEIAKIKEAGKIVVLDDNFKSIKDAIWYGRTIYHNILKFCIFQLVIFSVNLNCTIFKIDSVKEVS